SLGKRPDRKKHQRYPDRDDKNVEYASGMRQGMSLLVTNGGERGDHHVKAIEPWPTLDKMEARCSGSNDQQQCETNAPEIAKYFHFSRGSLVVGCRRTGRFCVIAHQQDSQNTARPAAT